MRRIRIVLSLLMLLGVSESLSADYLRVTRPFAVRTEPSRDADTAFQAKADTNLTLLESEQVNGYYHVQDPTTSEEGWIYRSFVRRFAGNVPSASTRTERESRTASGGKFPVGRCKAPYNETPEIGLDIDKTCGLAGDSAATTAEAVQNPVKNNLCGTGTAAVVTAPELSELQKEVDDAGIDYGSPFHHRGGPPKDRSPLQNLPQLSSEIRLEEGSLVIFVGYLVEAHYMPKSESKSKSKKGGESVNCHQTQHGSADIHLALALKAGRISAKDPAKKAKLCQTVSAEMIPHLRPAVWNMDNLDQVIDLERPVRVTGQLFFDGSHEPCQSGTPVGTDPARVAVWEIHPIYTFDVCKLDTLQKCDPRKSSLWQPISKANDVNIAEEEEDQ